ncbi:nicotinate-nucleotide--dimethylbenzimidazole phosphoribosyltransferase [Methylocella sp.]|uniref:nicotinate-nucleotide--dimethylbenzimidazole phosphoribosyltransferase n=1 Tax=Methylocella sp. TaxID=1978226 RepID=UPI0037846ADA
MTASASASPLDSIRELLAAAPPPSASAEAAARARQARLTKPAGSLGRLEDVAAFVAAWRGREIPTIERPLVAVFAGNHGVAERGVSAYPAAVTKQMLQNFSAGGAAVNQICSSVGAALKVFELALEAPTRDICAGPAMTEKEAAATFAYGMEAIDGGVDLLCVGEMGIANTTVAAAIYHALYGGKASDWTGPGTGVSGEALARKIDAVETAVALHRPFLDDPLQIMVRLGGREIAAMAGAIAAARSQNIPVVLDGYVACAAAAILQAAEPRALDHCLAGHLSAEPAHAEVLRRLGKAPLLDLGLRLGEGSGAALAVALIKAALACHSGMATFEEAGVSGKG